MRFALGTVQFGLNYGIANQSGQISLDEAKAIIKYSHANGINTLDTAIGYGDSEQRLGAIGVQDWQIVSKLPAIPDGCSGISQWVADTVNESLQRLKIKRLYGLLLHRPQQLTEHGGDQLYRALLKLKKDKLVQKIGISIYDPAELDVLCSDFQLDLVQAPFNIMDSRLIETGWMTRLNEQNIELHVRSVFLQGLLLMNPNQRPKKFHRWSSLWGKYDDWLQQIKLTPLQACLRYALSFSEINKVIIGVDSQNQLKEVLQAAKGTAPVVPDAFRTADFELINPSRWAALS